MSSFVRRQPVRAVDLGTRPGLHGQVLISSGLTGMDKLLGGGLPLGSILLIIEDSHSQQHLNLMKCFMAEGFCCKHTVGWVSANGLTPESTAGFLPCVAKLQSSESHQRQVSDNQQQHTTAHVHDCWNSSANCTSLSCRPRRLQLATRGGQTQAQQQAQKLHQMMA